MTRTLDEIVEDVFEWQQATFLDSTVEGRINHFKEEVAEWLEDPNNGEEASDVFMLFIAIFKSHNVDINAETEKKLAINKKRTWAKAPGGYSKHLKGESNG